MSFKLENKLSWTRHTPAVPDELVRQVMQILYQYLVSSFF